MNRVESIIDSLVPQKKKSKEFDKNWRYFCYMMCHEFGWTQKELMETDMSFALEMAMVHKEFQDKQDSKNKGSKKGLRF